MSSDRRAFLRNLALTLPALTLFAQGEGAAKATSSPAPSAGHDMSAFPPSWSGKEVIAMLIYPGFTALDMVGPHYFLSSLMGAKVVLVAKTKVMVTSDAGLKFMPDVDFDTCPVDLDLLVVPGGTAGTLAAMEDQTTREFVRRQAASAKRVASVCTGSLILGAAGLLKGKKATSHWLVKDLLPKFGAIPAEGRVVEDGRLITAAGVTAGMDFGLHMSLKLRDREYTDSLALLAEYAPEPPTSAGDPAKAPPKVRQMMELMMAEFRQKVASMAVR
jgi:putative intracellular protease/amidase